MDHNIDLDPNDIYDDTPEIKHHFSNGNITGTSFHSKDHTQYFDAEMNPTSHLTKNGDLTYHHNANGDLLHMKMDHSLFGEHNWLGADGDFNHQPDFLSSPQISTQRDMLLSRIK